MGKSQSEVIEELIIKVAEEREREKRLRAFRNMIKLVEEIKPVAERDYSFKKAKEEMGVEKYI